MHALRRRHVDLDPVAEAEQPLGARALPDQRVERADQRPRVHAARQPRARDRGSRARASPRPRPATARPPRPAPPRAPRLGGGEPEVVAQVALGRDAERARGDAHELALGVLDGGRRRRDHRGGQHALGQVVEALEAAPPRGRDLPAPEQPLERALDVAPVPPRAGARRALLLDHVAGRDRAARAHLVEHVRHQLGAVAPDPPHPAPGLVRRAVHAPAQRRLQGDRDQRRLVAPVLEQPPRRAVGGAVEQRDVVRAGAAEQRQVVRALEHVDRVDLHHADAVEQPPHRPARGRARRRAGRRSPGRRARRGAPARPTGARLGGGRRTRAHRAMRPRVTGASRGTRSKGGWR